MRKAAATCLINPSDFMCAHSWKESRACQDGALGAPASGPAWRRFAICYIAELRSAGRLVFRAIGACDDFAEFNSAIQQIANLRYDARRAGGRRSLRQLAVIGGNPV